MSTVFYTYLELGFHHVFDLKAYDHLLLLIALCAVYTIGDWRRVVALITCFTIGLSIALALSAFHIIQFDKGLIRFLMPATIFLVCVINFFRLKGAANKQHTIFSVYNLVAVLIGLVHGLGFSNHLKSLFRRGDDAWLKMLAFNVGIELSQLLFVFLVLIVAFLIQNLFNAKRRDWIMVLSSAVAGISLILMMKANIFF
ncbi:HupE/UreJ family protein [Pontibacter burrus]|uniref:HupE/UreJ family protein n=1 Tax=Pontibacter burrus TaxID=2704466 RepID=A0A6B3LJS1_9BACT|nr:HupE/UreJ family protein [Pontibacter burrus]NEM96959.1 HupE/UreJ family protein [Pontibacter burrus]